uniref:Uncharacterized protein n=1 Tax=virus sp. ctBM815 TaxID=2825806 RepID=A0A8S5RJV1_9VIRU|nr:MAG TPA: hypothetical protein [virus sp. ctBM815]
MNTQNNQYLDDYVEKYRDIKEKWLKDFNKSHGTTSEFCKKHGIHGLRRKRSWLILLKRNLVEIESRKKTTKLNRTELMEGYVQHKLQKWERKHPCPVKKDDLFYAQQFPVWEAEKNAAEERIRDLVVAKYDKLQLIGRFSSTDELFHEQEIAQIKDNGETAKHGGVNNLPESSKVMKMARKETNKVKAKRSNLICTNLKDHRKKTGRILLPGANKMRMAA